MKKFYLIASIMTMSILLISCKQSTYKNEASSSETEEVLLLEDEIEEKASLDPNFLDYSIAYIKSAKLYFYDYDNHKAVEFVEEADTVLHCAYADDGYFYYTTSKNNQLTLKKIDFVNDNKITELYDFDIPADEFVNDFTNSGNDMLVINNHLILDFHFDWNYYDLTKCVEYSLENNEAKVYEDFEIRKKYNLISQRDELEHKYRDLCKQAEKLDYPSQYKNDGIYEYHFHNESGDGSHLYFAVILAWGDLPHGAYVLSTTDGSKMKILNGTDMSSPNRPKWLENNVVYTVFKRIGEVLYITNLDRDEPQLIDERVNVFTVRK